MAEHLCGWQKLLHYLDPKSLRSDPQYHSVIGNGTWLMFLPLAPIKTSSAGLLILAFVTVMLSVSCLLLLTHLLGFHFYLCESQSLRKMFDIALFHIFIHSSSQIPCGVSYFLGYTVYKGISTYDYVKMQRQKNARNQDVEAGNPHDVKVNNNSPQNQESSIDCEPSLSQSSSTCKSDDKGPLSSRFSESICTESWMLKFI
ncbi:hypothetical protein PAMP_003211 [Pampus punctatissimus]